jgi:hypothetical protein
LNHKCTGMTFGLLLTISISAAGSPPPLGPPILKGPPPVSRTFAPPAPGGFTAQPVGNGTVNLSWQAVPNASQYHLDGAGIVPAGFNLLGTATNISLNSVPAGVDTWHVTAFYASTPGVPATTTAIVRVLPAHPMPWLSLTNGPGDATTNTIHYTQFCPGFQAGADCFTPLNSLITPAIWLWGDLVDYENGVAVPGAEAVYGNVGDLGFGRRTQCAQQTNSQVTAPNVAGAYTVCYATNHGNSPGQLGFDVAPFIARAAAGEDPPPPPGSPICGGNPCLKNPWGSLPRTASVIVKGPQGFTFMSMSMGAPYLFFNVTAYGPSWYQMPNLVSTVVLDSEGSKHQPHACLACHGGYYDTATGRVQGATLLPIDPAMVAFPVTQPGDRSKYERPFQEENIRRVNAAILASMPSKPVADYIQGLYPTGVSQSGSVSQANYVPSGWAQQSGLYLSVVKPYCATCHMAQGNLNFSTWGNFLAYKQLIYGAVCQQKTMPHAEIPFRKFWTLDTGPVYLPGLLANSLGYASCP